MADIAELGFRLDTRDLTRGKGALDELSKSAEKAQQKSDGLGNALEKTKGSTSGAAKAAEEAAKSHDRLGSATERAKESTGALGEASKRTASSIGAIAVALGTTVAAATDANRVLREFSREMAALGAVLGGTSDQMAQLREQAKVMGATTKFGAQQAAEAQKNLAQAGLSVQQIMAATPKVLNLATAGNLELAQSAEFLIDVMSQANLTVADFGRISDVAVKAANLSTTSVAQLSQGYKYAMANGALLGMSIEEVTSALAVLAQAGLKAEQGGTGLRGIASRFMQPSKEMTKTLKENSISVNDLNIAARGLAPVLDTIAKSTLSIPELMELFGQEASSAGLALVKNRQQFVEWSNELKNVGGTTNQVAKDMSDQLDDAFRSVSSAVEGAYIAISDATGYEKGLQNALNFSSGVINHFSGMNESAVKAGLMTKQMAADFESSGNTITATLKVFAAVGAGAAMLAVPSIIAGIGSAATAAAGGVTALTAAIVANPIGLAAAGITAATAALYLFRDETVTIGDTTASVSDFIAATWDETAGQLIDAVMPFFDNFSVSLSAITGLAESDSQKIAAFFESAAGIIGAAIKGAINGALNAFPALVAGAAAAAKAVGDSFQAVMRADFSGAIDAIASGAKSTIDAYTSRLTQDTIGKAVSGTFDSIANNAKKRSEQTQAEAKRMAQSASYASAEIERLTARSKPMIAKVQPFSPVASKPDTGDDKKKKDKEAAKAAKELASEQAKLNDLLQKGGGFSATYAEKLALLAKYQSKIPVDEYRAAVEKLILTETEAGKTAAKHAEEVAKLQDTFREEDAKRAANLQIQNEELQFQSSLLGKTALEQAALTAQREEEKKVREEILDLTTKQAQAEQDGNQWAVTAIQDRINMLESEAAARKEAAAGIAMQKEIQQQWGNISADIERALTDSLMRGFDSGKNFADSLKDYIKNAFESLAIRILLQPVMGVVNSVGGQIYGQLMGGQPQQGQQQGGGSLNNLLSGFTSNSTGQTLSSMATSAGRLFGYNTAPLAAETVSMFVDGSQAIYGFTDAAATAAQSMGVLEGSISSIATNASAIPNWGYGVAGIGGGLAGGFIGDEVFGSKGYANTGGSLGGSAGASLALGAGAGPLGITAAVIGGSLLGGGLGSLFGDREPDMRKAKFGYGASNALREEGLRTGWTGSSAFGQFRTYDDKWFSGSEMGAAMGQFIDSLESLDNAVADSLKLTSDQTQSAIDALKAIDKEYSFGMQWGDFTANSKAREQIAVDRYATILDSVEAGWGDFVRQFQGSFDEFPAYLQGVIAAMSLFREESGELVDVFGKQIEGISAFAQFAKAGENNADAFKRLYSVFQATNAVLESLGKSTKGTGLESTALRESFIKLVGGMESLAGYVQEYNEGFFTAAEKEAKVREQLQREFDKYNATLPTTRLEWRKLMESLDLSTQAGQEAAAKLYQLQGAFLSITPEIESATEAAKDFKDEIADLEQYFRDQLNAVDYSGMTEQGQQAASALDELTAKLARLSEIGGDVDLGVQAISRYIKTEIPKLYADALAPFKQAGGRGYTDLGKSIFEILSQAKTAARAITEINNAELSALGWRQSEANTVAAKSTKSVSFGGTKDYGIVRETGYKSSLDELLNKYLTETGYSREQIENFGRGMLDANGNFVYDESKWSENKWLYDQFKQEVANLGRVSDSEIKAFISSGKTNEQIYAAAQEFGISAARLSEVMGVSKEEIKQWVGTNALAELTPDEVYRSSAKYNPDKKAIEILDSVSGLLTVVQAGTGGGDYANLDRLSVDPKEWRKAVADMLQAIPANAGYVMQDAINYAPSKFFSAGADKSFLRDYSDIDVTKDWSSLFSNPDMPSVQSFAKAAGLDFQKASDMLNSSGIVLNGLIDWAKVMTSSDPAKSLQGALNAISEDETLMKLQNKWQQTQGYSSVGDVSGIPQFVDTVTPAIDAVTEKAAEKIKEISASEVMSAADPVNALLQQSIGRDASAEERKQIEDAYNWGIANGKAIQDIVNDIANHAASLEQAVEKQVDATEKAATAATAATAAQSANNAPVHAGSYVQPSYDPSRLRQIEEDQKARERHLAAIKELANGFLASVHNEMQSSFDALNKESQMIGLSEIGRAAKDATDLLKDRMQSIVDVITLTAEGLKEIGVADLLAKSTEFADAYISGTIKTTEELQSSLDSLFEGVDGAEDIKKSVIESAESSKKLFDDTAKQLREQLVAPWQSAYESLASNSIGAEINAAIKAKDQALTDAKTLAESMGENFDDLAKEIQRGFDAQTQQLREQIVSPWRSAYDALTSNGIDAEIQAAIKAKDQALADAKTLAESLGQNFDDLAKEIQRGFDAQLFGLTKQKLQGVIDSISKIADFQAGIDDAIFGLRVGMSGADVSGLYAQRQADIKAQLDAAMQGDNLDEQISLANKLRETITQRYAAEQQAQERMMRFARGLDDYLRKLRTSDKSTGSIYDRLTEAQKQFAEDVALSRGTGAEADAARGRITNTSDTLLDLARQFYASGEGYQQIYNDVVGGLEGLQIDTRTEAERQLDAINAGNDSALKQIDELQALRGTFDDKLGVLQQQQVTYIAEMQKLAEQLGLSQSAILQALKDLPSGISGAIAGIMPMPTVGGAGGVKAPTAPSGGATQTAFEKAVQSYRETGAIAGGVATIAAAVAESGMGYTETILAIKDAAKIDGSHKDGLSHVPFDGYVAELHKGERVLTASENRDYSADVSRIMGGGYGGQSVAPLLNEIKALRQEVAQLRQQQSSEHQDDLRQREAIAKQSMGQTKDLQTAMIRNTALNI